MKICMITPRYPPNIQGGGEISCKLLVDNLIKNNFEVDVFSADQKFPNIKNMTLQNIKTYQYLKNKIKNYDIFHTYNMTLMPGLGILTKKYKVNSIATLNGIVYSISMSTYKYQKMSPRFFRNKLIINFIKNIKYFTTLFQYFKENWINDGIDDKKISVIPNMIDVSFKPIKNTKSDITRLLHVGNYTPTRSEEICKLIKVYSNLKKQNINLTMVGKGKNQVKKIINKYQPKNKIIHLGEKNYNELPKIYSNSDIFVHPSNFPKTGDRVIYEALMSGICVITTGNNNYSEIIKNNESGILVYPMTTEILAEKIQNLLDDVPLRKKLAQNGKKRIYDICSPDLIIKRYIKIYNNVTI